MRLCAPVPQLRLQAPQADHSAQLPWRSEEKVFFLVNCNTRKTSFMLLVSSFMKISHHRKPNHSLANCILVSIGTHKIPPCSRTPQHLVRLCSCSESALHIRRCPNNFCAPRQSRSRHRLDRSNVEHAKSLHRNVSTRGFQGMEILLKRGGENDED